MPTNSKYLPTSGAAHTRNTNALAVPGRATSGDRHGLDDSDEPVCYAVEVCWEYAGRVTCCTYQVCARSDEEAAAKGRIEARRRMRRTARIEVVDLARMPEIAEPLVTEDALS